MTRFRNGALLAVFLICLGTTRSAGAKEPKGIPSTPITSAPAYPESQEGLKNFLGDMLRAVRTGDQETLSLYLSNLAIPDHTAWFIRIFGPEEGHRMDSKYGELLPRMPDTFTKVLKYALDGQRTDIQVNVLQKPVDPSARGGRALTEAMIQPIPLYVASGHSPSQQYGAVLGDFAYVDGAFRYLDAEVLQALSTTPPMRIRQGGNVTATSLIHKVNPIYPNEAKANHTQGSVVLHVVIGVDGAVIQCEVINGDAILGKAAAAAVLQWKYKPTLLNSQPVEVDTTVTVDFHL
jgi:TonB family protein